MSVRKGGQTTTKGKKKKPKKPLTPKDRAKLRVARELGLYERVKAEGWGGLSAKECGRVGGMLSKQARVSRQRAE